MSYENNVFINCPFDDDYRNLLNPLLFTVIHCGFSPKISETKDSGENRLREIIKLIETSKYGIHDLCRMESSASGQLARFNMPFEFGLDLGCRKFKSGKYTEKVCLVLDEKKYRYQKAISDISGNDIYNHGSEPESLVRQIRNWFVRVTNTSKDSGNLIWMKYNEFLGDFKEIMNNGHFSDKDIKEMPLSEYISNIKSWIDGRNRFSD